VEGKFYEVGLPCYPLRQDGSFHRQLRARTTAV
jgi:hypothetical protein